MQDERQKGAHTHSQPPSPPLLFQNTVAHHVKGIHHVALEEGFHVLVQAADDIALVASEAEATAAQDLLDIVDQEAVDDQVEVV